MAIFFHKTISQRCRTRIIHEAENDAITLIHLMDQREELLQLN